MESLASTIAINPVSTFLEFIKAAKEAFSPSDTSETTELKPFQQGQVDHTYIYLVGLNSNRPRLLSKLAFQSS